MAPEVHAHRKATAFSDIFSLHVVMWEVSLVDIGTALLLLLLLLLVVVVVVGLVLLRLLQRPVRNLVCSIPPPRRGQTHLKFQQRLNPRTNPPGHHEPESRGGSSRR